MLLVVSPSEFLNEYSGYEKRIIPGAITCFLNGIGKYLIINRIFISLNLLVSPKYKIDPVGANMPSLVFNFPSATSNFVKLVKVELAYEIPE